MFAMTHTLLDFLMDPNWYLDSGATNHYTLDLFNLSNKTDFHGSDNIYMVNGESLAISHIGSSSFSTICSNKPCLQLINMLHVPRLTKNLISVSKFTADNDVFFEFHPNICFVKDQQSETIKLQGSLKNGLYTFGTKPLAKQMWRFRTGSHYVDNVQL